MPDQPQLRIGVLALQGDYDAHTTALAEAAADSGIPASAVLVRKPEELADPDGLIVPGGEATTFLKFLERDGFLADLQKFVAGYGLTLSSADSSGQPRDSLSPSSSLASAGSVTFPFAYTSAPGTKLPPLRS